MERMQIYGVSFDMVGKQPIVLLKTAEGNRFLPIWIGPFEADAITMQLQGVPVTRPLTHDLLKTVIEQLGGEVLQIVINGLERNTYFARIVLDVDGDNVEIDSRPSDAIALAVRVSAPIFVSDEVMDQAALLPEEEMPLSGSGEKQETEEVGVEDLGAFKDFVEGLDLDKLLGN